MDEVNDNNQKIAEEIAAAKMREREDKLAQAEGGFFRRLVRNLADQASGQAIGSSNSAVREQAMRDFALKEELANKAQKRLLDEQERKQAAALNSPESEESMQVREAAVSRLTSLAKILNTTMGTNFSNEDITDFVGKRSGAEILKTDKTNTDILLELAKFKKDKDLAAKKAQDKAEAASKKSDETAKREKRLFESEVRRIASQQKAQLAPMQRELAKKAQGVERVLDLSTLALKNAIAKGSLGFAAAIASGSNSQLSDKEREVFTRAGGAMDKATQAFKDLESGTLNPNLADQYKAWALVLKKRYEEQLQQQREEFKQSVQGFYPDRDISNILDLDKLFNLAPIEEKPVENIPVENTPVGDARKARLQEIEKRIAELKSKKAKK